MDSQTTTAIAYAGFITSLATAIIGYINHKRIRSRCCGKEISSSIDIEDTTPQTKCGPILENVKAPSERSIPV
jgi:hypothetical protein